jgi:hypothetical protein
MMGGGRVREILIEVVSPLWRKANINGGWSRMGFCCLKDGHEKREKVTKSAAENKDI